MTRYTITAQNYLTSQRIARIVLAVDKSHALRLAAPALDAAGFYAISITAA